MQSSVQCCVVLRSMTKVRSTADDSMLVSTRRLTTSAMNITWLTARVKASQVWSLLNAVA